MLTMDVAALVLCLALAGGCSSDSESNPSPESTAGSTGAWEIQEVPSLRIGEAYGQLPYEFSGIAGARRLEDGRIVVADQDTRELRWFDSAGVFLFAKGRDGEGPGEFRDIESLFRTESDTLVAFDPRLQRLSFFSPDGTLLRVLRLPPLTQEPFLRPAGVFSDGSVLAYAERSFHPSDMGTVIGGEATYYRIRSDGSEVDTLGAFPARTYYIFQTPSGGVTPVLKPFQAIPRWVVSGEDFYFGTAEEERIQILSPTGDLRRLVTLDQERVPVTQEVIDRYRVERLASIENPAVRRTREEMVERVGFPDSMPAHENLEVDAEGNLWVEEYQPWEDSECRWFVFDSRGHFLGSGQMPNGLEVEQIGTDFVLGLRVDEMGVEYVELHHLARPDQR